MASPITTGAPNGNPGIVPPLTTTTTTGTAAPNGNTGIVPPSIPGSGLQPVDTNGDFHILPVDMEERSRGQSATRNKGQQGRKMRAQKAQMNLMERMLGIIQSLVSMLGSLMNRNPTTQSPTVNPTPRFLGPPTPAPTTSTGQVSTRGGDGFTSTDYNPYAAK